MKQAGADASKVRFATLGPNIYDAVPAGPGSMQPG